MNVFQLIHTVLDELYAAIPGSDIEKDDAVKKQLTALNDGYSKLSVKNNITYTDPATRFAYIYRYVTSHSNLVYQAISSTTELVELFKCPKVNVSCVGGGPGSDLLGILKYLSFGKNKCTNVRCHLLDGENAWADAWSDVDQKLASQCTISTYFLAMNICEAKSWSLHSKYLNADLITMIYFMSEIYSRQKESQPYFEHLFQRAKKGSLFLYIDNNSGMFFDWFDQLAKTSGLDVLRKEQEKMGMPPDEEKKDLGKYFEKFGPVKLDANVAYRICRKL